MTDYLLETREFGLSDKGIHLLRSRFNYQTIDYNDIDELVIEKGKELNNWALLLVIGLGLLLFSFWYSFRLFGILDSGEVRVIYIEEIIVPVIPFLAGLYFTYSSTRNATIMKVKTKDTWLKKLSLADIEKDKNMDKLKSILHNKMPGRLKGI
ncbi:MAG: hypothetical protein HOP30_11885 [Cyclobacteriaceae bacterium]|nr:hypothetical protein [Cyclobacteriaceae bacterium]